MAVPPLDLLPPTVAVKRVAWGRFRAASSPHASSAVPKQAARAQPPRFAPVTATPWLTWDVLTAGYILFVHCLACAAPFTYTPSALWVFAVTYLLTGCLGVTFCFHRLLSHRSFVVPKWLEYPCAWLGCLASQSVRCPALCSPAPTTTFPAPRPDPSPGWLLLPPGPGRVGQPPPPGASASHACWAEGGTTLPEKGSAVQLCEPPPPHRRRSHPPPTSLPQHHVATDTPADPHSPLQSAWWSHVGWLLDRAAVRVRLANNGGGNGESNVKDLLAQRFYVVMEATYELQLLASVVALYCLGGLPWVTWGYGLRTVVRVSALLVSRHAPPPCTDLFPAVSLLHPQCLWHSTFCVNSVCHIWGGQAYETGDESRNNGVVAVLAFGEGWHNNHHAFAFSARHGLEWWQMDATWLLIRGLQVMGLATQVKLPTQAQKGKLLRAR